MEKKKKAKCRNRLMGKEIQSPKYKTRVVKSDKVYTRKSKYDKGIEH